MSVKRIQVHEVRSGEFGIRDRPQQADASHTESCFEQVPVVAHTYEMQWGHPLRCRLAGTQTRRYTTPRTAIAKDVAFTNIEHVQCF